MWFVDLMVAKLIKVGYVLRVWWGKVGEIKVLKRGWILVKIEVKKMIKTGVENGLKLGLNIS